MRKSLFVALTVIFALGGMVSAAMALPDVGNNSVQGSLVIYPKVLVKGTKDASGQWLTLDLDTVLTLTNTNSGSVNIECYWMDEFQNHSSFGWAHTKTDPSYKYASDVMRTTAVYDESLDPPVYQYDYAVGEVKCWAVDAAVTNEISWNFLHGTATIFDFVKFTAEQYSSWNAPEVDSTVDTGAALPTPGELYLNGKEYAGCARFLYGTFFPQHAELKFYSDLTPPTLLHQVDAFTTDITLVPCDQDLRQDYVPIPTKANFLVWDDNEFPQNTQYVCFKCWMEVTLTYPAEKSGGVTKITNFDTFGNFLTTDVAYFSVQSQKSSACPRVTYEDEDGNILTAPQIQTAFIGVMRTTAQIDKNAVAFATNLAQTQSLFVAQKPVIKYDVFSTTPPVSGR